MIDFGIVNALYNCGPLAYNKLKYFLSTKQEAIVLLPHPTTTCLTLVVTSNLTKPFKIAIIRRK